MKKFNEDGLDWITYGHTESEKALILKTIKENEAAGNNTYRIDLPNGDYYEVQNGQIIGSKRFA